MEKRLLLALLLSAIVFVVYEWLYPPQRSTLAGANGSGTPSVAASSTATPAPTPSAATPNVPPALAQAPSAGAAPSVPAESLAIRTSDAVFRFTNIGAAPVSVEMLHYQNMRARTQNVALSPVVRYQIVGTKDTLDLSRTAFQMQKTATGVSFTGQVNGSRVDLTYTIPAQGY